MNKKIIMAVLCVVMAVALSGCGGPGNPLEWDNAAERANLVCAASRWAGGIEDYDIDAMAGNNIMAAGFRLTINENGESDTKTREVLISELGADAENQANFRYDSAYELRLDIDSDGLDGDIIFGEDDVNAWTIVNISQYEADVTGFFEVFEESTGVPRWRSDSGQISMHFIRSYGAWMILSMEIRFGAANYPSDPGADAASTRAIAGPRARGFGF